MGRVRSTVGRQLYVERGDHRRGIATELLDWMYENVWRYKKPLDDASDGLILSEPLAGVLVTRGFFSVSSGRTGIFACGGIVIRGLCRRRILRIFG